MTAPPVGPLTCFGRADHRVELFGSRLAEGEREVCAGEKVVAHLALVDVVEEASDVVAEVEADAPSVHTLLRGGELGAVEGQVHDPLAEPLEVCLLPGSSLELRLRGGEVGGGHVAAVLAGKKVDQLARVELERLDHRVAYDKPFVLQVAYRVVNFAVLEVGGE